MKQKKLWKQLAAWTLAASMVVGNNSVMVLAESVPEAEAVDFFAEVSADADETDASLAENENGLEENADDSWFAETEEGFVSDSTDELNEFMDGESGEPGQSEDENSNAIAFHHEGDDRHWDDGYTMHMFNNEDYTLCLDNADVLPEGTEIQWQVGTRNEGIDGAVDFQELVSSDENNWYWNASGTEIILHGESLSDVYKNAGKGYWIEVRAFLMGKEEGSNEYTKQLAEIGAGVHVRDAVYDPQLPGDEETLMGRNIWISSSMEYHVEDTDHPYGDQVHYDVIKNVEVENVADENDGDDSPVCEVSVHDGGWNIRSLRTGKAKATITYTNIQNKEEKSQHSFYIYVNSDRYYLSAKYPNDDNRMLPGADKDIQIELHHEWNYGSDGEDEDCGDELVQNYSLDFADEKKYDSDVLSAVTMTPSESNPGAYVLHIEARDDIEEERGTSVHIKALMPEEVASEFYGVQITKDYYAIGLKENVKWSDNLEVGDTVDLEAFQVKHNTWDGDQSTDVTNKVNLKFTDLDSNSWSWKETEDGTFTELTRTSPDGVEFTVEAFTEDENGEEIELDRKNYWFNGQDYSLGFENLRGEDGHNTDIYEGEAYELRLDMKTFDFRNLTYGIEWEVGTKLVEEGDEDSFTQWEGDPFWSEDEEYAPHIFIYGDGLKAAEDSLEDGQYIAVRATVKLNGVWASMAEAGLHSKEATYDYDTMPDRELLINQSVWVDRWMGCYVEDGNYPDGEHFNVDVTNVTVENPEVCEIHEDEDGWDIQAKQWGETDITVTYRPYNPSAEENESAEEGKVKDYKFHISVKRDVYYLEIQKDNGDNRMLPGSEKQIYVKLHHDWNYDEDEEGGNLLTDYTIEAEGDNGDLVTVSVTDSENETETKIVTVTAGQVLGGTNILLKAFIPGTDEEGSPISKEVASDEIPVEIRDAFEIIQAEHLENPMVGEVLDLNQCNFRVWVYDSREDDPMKKEGIRFRFEYDDENAWDVEEAGESEKETLDESDTSDDSEDPDDSESETFTYPILTRKSADGTGLRVIAQEWYRDEEGNEGWEDCGIDRYFWFDGLDYSIWFDEPRTDDNYNIGIFEEENYSLSLNTENLDDKNDVTIEWQVGTKKKAEEGEEDEGSFQERDAFSFWKTDPENTSRIIINGSQLKEAETTLSEDEYIAVRAIATVNEYEVSCTEAGLYVREERYDYENKVEDRQLLVDQSMWVDNWMNCYVENAEHRDGADFEYTVKDVTVPENSSCEVYRDENGNGCSIQARGIGDTEVTVYYMPKPENGDSEGEDGDSEGEDGVSEENEVTSDEEFLSYTFQIQVVSDTYYLETRFIKGENLMLIGGEVQIEVRLHHDWAYSDEKRGTEVVKNYSLALAGYDETLIDVSMTTEGEKRILTVKGKKGAKGNTNIELSAAVPEIDEDGNPTSKWQEVDGTDIWIGVSNSYEILRPVTLENLKVGDSLDLNEFKMYQVYLDKDGVVHEQVREDIGFRFVYDPNDWETLGKDGDITEPNEGPAEIGSYPTLVRTNPDGINLTVEEWELVEGENGDKEWQNTDTAHEYWFDGLDYSVWFENLRENDYATYVFSNEENYHLNLNTENLKQREVEEFEIYWQVGFRTGEDSFEAITDESGYETFWSKDPDNKSSLIIDGEKLEAAYKQLREDSEKGEDYWFEARAIVELETPNGGYTLNMLQAGLWSRNPVADYQQQIYDASMFPGDKIWLGNTLECYVEDAENLQGNTVKIPVTSVDLTTVNWGEGDVAPVTMTEGSDCWFFTANHYGEAKVTVHFKKLDSEMDSHEFYIHVTDRHYWIEPEYGDGSVQMLNGDNKTIKVKVYCEELQEDGTSEKYEMKTSDYDITISSDYEPQILEVLAVNNGAEEKSLTVKANESGDEHILVDVTSKETWKDEKGNEHPVWETSAGIYVSVSDDFYYEFTVEGETPSDIPVGGTLDLNDLDKMVELIVRNESESDNADKVVEDNVRYRLSYDEDVWKPLEATQEQDIPVLTRISGVAATVTLIAEVAHTDRYNNEVWEYAGEQYFSFERIMKEPGSVSIGGITSEEFGYTDIANTEILKLRTKIPGESDATVKWTLYYNENGSEVPVSQDCYSVKEDGAIDLYGAKLGKLMEELKEKGIEALYIRVEASCGEQIIGSDEVTVLVQHSEAGCEHQWKHESYITGPTCTADGTEQQRCKLCGETREASVGKSGHNWKDNGTVAATCTKVGSHNYICTRCNATRSDAIAKLAHTMDTVIDTAATCGKAGQKHKECKVCHGADTKTAYETIPATGKHTWTGYKVSEEATAVKAGTEVRTCTTCGAKETRSIAKLAAYVKVKESSFPMKKSQTLKLAVTLEKGDSIASVKSSSTKKLTVSKTSTGITLKATKKGTSGKVKVTIKTAGGASKVLTVKLQKGTVAAKKIIGVPSKATLKVKKKLILKPVVSPVSYQTTVKYTTSNKKVATVSKKGVITAKKAGKATITVTCGKIKKTCKITVKKK